VLISRWMRVLLHRLDGVRPSAVEGELRFPPAKGNPVILMVGGGLQEYVTTAVERMFAVVGTDRVYFETRNSTYRLETSREGKRPGRRPRKREAG